MMEVTHYIDDNGDLMRQVVSRSYRSLLELKYIYEKAGCRAWLNLYDQWTGKWVLTVDMVPEGKKHEKNQN